MANLFIWSGFKFYIKQDTDSYILFSPIKYWKSQKIIAKEFIKGFVFNRKHFHATASAVVCALWSGKESMDSVIGTQAYDIDKDNLLVDMGRYDIKQVSTLLSEYYDKRSFATDSSGIVCAMDGSEGIGKKVRIKPICNENIVGYMITQSFGFENPRLATNLTICPMYNGNGFYLRSDNYLCKLPLFCAGKYYIEDSWIENGTVYKSFDAGDKFIRDKDFLKSCLLYTCLTYYNKCLSFKGSDGRDYQNQLCFDSGALALNDLQGMQLNNDERELIGLWNKILAEAKQTKSYDGYWRYGVYQITKELNTFVEVGVGKNKKKVYDYPELNGDLITLRTKLKEYYKKYITPKMFEYELIK